MSRTVIKKAVPITEFLAMCKDDQETNGSRDYPIKVVCHPDKVTSFKKDWDKCQKKAMKCDEYSVNDIYALMKLKGYTITGILTPVTVWY